MTDQGGTFELSAAAMRWLRAGERGSSSNSIFEHLTGLPTVGVWGLTVPSDPSDLRRCIQLLEQVPEFAPRIGEMATASPEWARLAARWDEVVALYHQEVPARTCPKTWALMQAIQEGM